MCDANGTHYDPTMSSFCSQLSHRQQSPSRTGETSNPSPRSLASCLSELPRLCRSRMTEGVMLGKARETWMASDEYSSSLTREPTTRMPSGRQLESQMCTGVPTSSSGETAERTTSSLYWSRSATWFCRGRQCHRGCTKSSWATATQQAPTTRISPIALRSLITETRFLTGSTSWKVFPEKS